MDALVSTRWLGEELGAPDLAIVDSTLFLGGRNARAEYLARHIPGARFLDIDAVADHSHAAPHMLPNATAFAAAMESLGVRSDDRIVVYDNSPLRSAVRGWFMLRHFGARQVAILDGGFGKWVAEGRFTESGKPAPRVARFDAREPRDQIVRKDQIPGLSLPLVDARGRARFEGSEADPRAGVAPGHIPGANNLPYPDLWNDDGTMKDVDAIRAAFAVAGADPQAPFVATCGSGVTANSLIFAAHRLGNDAAKLYDGSWSEWGADPATPKELGPAKP
ncbi:MAG: sulfurtransferase [Sphingomonadales bacterium]|nr:sulfurtransferase [Sphingomonadales bacterium]